MKWPKIFLLLSLHLLPLNYVGRPYPGVHYCSCLQENDQYSDMPLSEYSLLMNLQLGDSLFLNFILVKEFNKCKLCNITKDKTPLLLKLSLMQTFNQKSNYILIINEIQESVI